MDSITAARSVLQTAGYTGRGGVGDANRNYSLDAFNNEVLHTAFAVGKFSESTLTQIKLGNITVEEAAKQVAKKTSYTMADFTASQKNSDALQSVGGGMDKVLKSGYTFLKSTINALSDKSVFDKLAGADKKSYDHIDGGPLRLEMGDLRTIAKLGGDKKTWPDFGWKREDLEIDFEDLTLLFDSKNNATAKPANLLATSKKRQA
jgi:hypothetical protein